MGIMALLLTISFPTIYRQLHPESMQKAVNDVIEACEHARAMSILNGVDAELQIRPRDRTITVTQSSGPRTMDQTPDGFSPSVSGQEWRMSDRSAGGGGGSAGGFSRTLAPTITIEGLGINGLDYTDDEVAYVQFHRNSTSDEMSIVLLSDSGERRNIWLEVVTALAEVETDRLKFRAR
jgi:hypothetical protein